MASDTVAAKASTSDSGRASPRLRAGRDVEEAQKGDKTYKRYGAGIEKALSSFEPLQQEWADYIAFLGRLLKAIQAYKDVPAIPHATLVALRLAQCLNPSLPSGVHQKALEVYAAIFGSLGNAHLGRDLQVYLPGLLPLLSFASLKVRPILYDVYDQYILKLDATSLRPALKSLVLGILPGLEDETSEDFERGIDLLDRIRTIISTRMNAGPTTGGGFFWQCFFLAVITSENKRAGALAYLTRRLPKFGHSTISNSTSPVEHAKNTQLSDEKTDEIAAITRPEPGLLIRCFAAGLQDPNILVQRGFLDLLVTHMPLHCRVLRKVVSSADLDTLVGAATAVVLRRDMSLNRRLWTWFLGPELTGTDGPDDQVSNNPNEDSSGDPATSQILYFNTYGAETLKRQVLASFRQSSSSGVRCARPFRVCTALMDRWEIGGLLVPHIFIPALTSAFEYETRNLQSENDEVFKSASLFFDGIESGLIWSQMVDQLLAGLENCQGDPRSSERTFTFLNFMITRFNVREEDMLMSHIPKAALIALHGLEKLQTTGQQHQTGVQSHLLDLVDNLVTAIPARALKDCTPETDVCPSLNQMNEAVQAMTQTYRNYNQQAQTPLSAAFPLRISHLLLRNASLAMVSALSNDAPSLVIGRLSDIFATLCLKSSSLRGVDIQALLEQLLRSWRSILQDQASSKSNFAVAAALSHIWAVVLENASTRTSIPVEHKTLIDSLIGQYTWQSLDLDTPKHHVEAVRVLWRIARLSSGSNSSFRIEDFVSRQLQSPSHTATNLERFSVLWEHSVQQQSLRNERRPGNPTRRSSSHVHSLEIGPLEAERQLRSGLLILLDAAYKDSGETSAFTKVWLRGLTSLDRVFSALLTQMRDGLQSIKTKEQQHMSSSRVNRHNQDCMIQLYFTSRRLDCILRHGSDRSWQILAALRCEDEREGEEERAAVAGTDFLASFCLDLLEIIDCSAFHDLQRQLLKLLSLLLDTQTVLQPQHGSMSGRLISIVREVIAKGETSMQTEYLSAITKSIKASASVNASGDVSSAGEPSGKAVGPGQTSSGSGLQPPAGLFECIREAIPSTSTRHTLEHWIQFLANILPIYAQFMFSAVIPLVECFCRQIRSIFRALRRMSVESITAAEQVPISSMPWLLSGLELVLASAHAGLQVGAADVASTRHSPSTPTLFNVGILSPIGNPNKTAKSNSRLTVILCVHDVVTICFTMWAWASYRSEAEGVDPSSASTTTFNALKLRNRTKKILDHLFSAEGLECTEKMMSLYVQARTNPNPDFDPSNVLNLLNVLGATRPRNTVPVILNALYSRTNAEALDSNRRSSMTCDLSAIEVIDFLLRYIASIEDDALDEVWTDCITFLRDVLSNPLPHRQILPSLLEFIGLLAEKVNNTNFGELQQMHRALADLFARLLTATFTVKPAGSAFDSFSKAGGRATSAPDLTNSLIAIAPKLQIVLEGNDRILTAVNTITTHVIGPNFHAKSFPENVTPGLLQLTSMLSSQAPEAKLWRKEINDAFGDSRIFASSPSTMQVDWFPVLRRWSLSEKNVVQDTLAKIVAPSAATLMFGVGANSARLAADRTAQHNLRRVALLLLATDRDFMIPAIQNIDAKASELCTASSTSSPSSSTRAEIFMLWRALFLTTSEIHLAGLWPSINVTLQAALLSALPSGAEQETYNNLSLLQACKFLDLLATIQPEDFQLHEWAYITNTIDAVYSGTSGAPALVDEVAEALTATADEGVSPSPVEPHFGTNGAEPDGLRRPALVGLTLDTADIKAMARDDFIRLILKPFFSGLSMASYEKTYAMSQLDVDACRKDLVEDLMDESTVVDK